MACSVVTYELEGEGISFFSSRLNFQQGSLGQRGQQQKGTQIYLTLVL